MVNVTLNGIISDMTSYFELLDKEKFKIPYESTAAKWGIIGSPAKLAARCAEVVEQNDVVKKKMHEKCLQSRMASCDSSLSWIFRLMSSSHLNLRGRGRSSFTSGRATGSTRSGAKQSEAF